MARNSRALHPADIAKVIRGKATAQSLARNMEKRRITPEMHPPGRSVLMSPHGQPAANLFMKHWKSFAFKTGGDVLPSQFA